MTKIAETLGLKASASEEQILKALERLHADHLTGKENLTAAGAELQRLQASYEAAAAELAQLRVIPQQDTPAVNAAALAAKRAAGLSRDQALSVLAAQAAHDATEPHDVGPEGAD